jgi:nicotinamidase-related amidase
MTNKALILVDFENEWIDKHSSEYVGKLSAVLKRTNQLIDKCRRENTKSFLFAMLKKTPKPSGPKNQTAQNHRQLHRRPTDTLITKYKISAFFKTSLERELKAAKKLSRPAS